MEMSANKQLQEIMKIIDFSLGQPASMNNEDAVFLFLKRNEDLRGTSHHQVLCTRYMLILCQLYKLCATVRRMTESGEVAS